MKTCPTCHTQYTDNTLRFCLQDGSVLEAEPATSEPTISLRGGNPNQVEGFPERSDSVETQWKRESEAALAPQRVVRSRTRIGLIVSALVLIGLLLGGAAAIALWAYYGGTGTRLGNNAENLDRNRGSTPANKSIVYSTPTPRSTPTAPATPPYNANSDMPVDTPMPHADESDASEEVSQLIFDWKSDAESGDLDSQMQAYAPSVNYYKKRAATREFIRADRARAYRLYDSMSISISNMNVSIDESGETATAVFDKEWSFDGVRRSSGKVRQQLRFRTVSGRWLITGERDLRVFYTN